MNLLTDPWIPVREAGEFKLITYKSLLCGDGDFAIALTRDDMELACLQLLVSLTQVLFTPKDKAELLDRIDNPLSEPEYERAIEPFIDWFDLAHRQHPFMQVRRVTAAKTTPIQKLFTGLPGGNNHAFFNDSTEITRVGLPAAAIALFNQASTGPNFVGGSMGGLRGVPVTTLVQCEALATSTDNPESGRLRRLVWWNVLHFDQLKNWNSKWRDWDFDYFRQNLQLDEPTWVKPFKRDEKIAPNDIGLLRGLFWQPAHVELIIKDCEAFCDFFLQPANKIVEAYKFAKFKYDLAGLWQHPHSATFHVIDKGKTKQGYISFRKTDPAWTQLSDFLFKKSETHEGKNKTVSSTPAAIVHQARELSRRSRPLHLSLGGYLNKQAAVIERRHELVQLGLRWEDAVRDLAELIKDAEGYRTKLYGHLVEFGVSAVGEHKKKRNKPKPEEYISLRGNKLFYQQTEELIHKLLREELDDQRWGAQRLQTANRLKKICLAIFDQLTLPYQHKPKMMIALARSRSGLQTDLARLRKDMESA